MKITSVKKINPDILDKLKTKFNWFEVKWQEKIEIDKKQLKI